MASVADRGMMIQARLFRPGIEGRIGGGGWYYYICSTGFGHQEIF